MANIHGTGKSETLIGTPSSDLIDGRGGDDIIDGGSGTDILTGGHGADTFLFHDQSQYDIITEFNSAEGDTLVFGTDPLASNLLYSGPLTDGLSFDTGNGICHVSFVDENGDGILDTQLNLNGDNLFLLGGTDFSASIFG